MQSAIAGAGLYELDAVSESFPKELRKWLREHLGLALLKLGDAEPFAALGWGPWAVLSFIAARWSTHEKGHEAWPSQETIGRHVRASERSVRAFVAELELGGFLAKRRERQARGHEWLYYSPGPVLLAAVTELARRYPKGDDEPRRRLASVPKPPEVASGRAAEATSDEPGKPSSLTSCASANVEPLSPPAVTSEAPPAPAPAPEEKKADRSRGAERSTAERAIAYRFAKLCPGRAPQRYTNVRDLEIVEPIARELTGSQEEQDQTMRDAVDGAWARSRIGPPRLKYIFGSLEDFYGHAAEGFARRRLAVRNAERAAGAPVQTTLKAPELVPATPEEIAEMLASCRFE
jgi:hypothetical protein